MTPDQVKAARALLGWSLDRLAARSGTSVPMVTAFEQTGRVVFSNGRSRALPVDAVAAVRTALEAAGIEFLEQNGGGPGVRLRNTQVFNEQRRNRETEMPNIELAKLLIERYKGDRERYQETLRILNEGWRHFDYKPFDGLLEVTEDYRKSTLASIARLEKLIARYENDLKGVT